MGKIVLHFLKAITNPKVYLPGQMHLSQPHFITKDMCPLEVSWYQFNIYFEQNNMYIISFNKAGSSTNLSQFSIVMKTPG